MPKVITHRAALSPWKFCSTAHLQKELNLLWAKRKASKSSKPLDHTLKKSFNLKMKFSGGANITNKSTKVNKFKIPQKNWKNKIIFQEKLATRDEQKFEVFDQNLVSLFYVKCKKFKPKATFAKRKFTQYVFTGEDIKLLEKLNINRAKWPEGINNLFSYEPFWQPINCLPNRRPKICWRTWARSEFFIVINWTN